MEMQIVVPDEGSASALAQRLSMTFGSERISLAAERREVDVLVDQESDPAILRILEAVERWLDQAAVGTAEMRLGGHSYTLARWLPVDQ